MSAAQRLPSVLEVKLEIVSGGAPLQGQSFVFQQEVIRLGRGPENDISLSQDLKVSREHCVLEVSNKAVYLKCLNEKNPIWVDGDWVQQKQLPPGSQIRLGDTDIRLIFKGAVSAAVPVSDAPVKLLKEPSRSKMPNLGILQKSKDLRKPSPPAVGQGYQASQSSQVAPIYSPQANAIGSQTPYSPGVAQGSSVKRQGPRVVGVKSSSDGRLIFYLVIAAAVGFFIFMMGQDKAKAPAGVQLRDRVVSEANIQASEQEVEVIEKEVSRTGRDTVQFRLAEEQFHRGFRDYLNGQYSRAMEQFNAALSFFPEHRQSRRYFHLARRKFDQQIQSYMRQGQRYYGIQNYRLCASFYSKVVSMVRDANNPQRKEAIQYLRECQVRMQAGGL